MTLLNYTKEPEKGMHLGAAPLKMKRGAKAGVLSKAFQRCVDICSPHGVFSPATS